MKCAQCDEDHPPYDESVEIMQQPSWFLNDDFEIIGGMVAVRRRNRCSSRAEYYVVNGSFGRWVDLDSIFSTQSQAFRRSAQLLQEKAANYAMRAENARSLGDQAEASERAARALAEQPA